MEVAEKYSVDDVIEYVVFIVHKFARTYHLTRCEAFDYLREFKGIEFLRENYGFEHTQNPYWTVKDLLDICQRNGGYSLPKKKVDYYE
ncbi:MAG: DUF3791 domain-containing protein [Prevotellaceae bacterium]|jgi:hypothetical protein|nr:DUF3791 domain-containing protein [Prevotellaceae bacterium]